MILYVFIAAIDIEVENNERRMSSGDNTELNYLTEFPFYVLG